MLVGESVLSVGPESRATQLDSNVLISYTGGMKVLLYTHDPMLTLCRLPEEAVELFGEDALEDAVEIPDELALEVQATYRKLCELSGRLAKIRRESER